MDLNPSLSKFLVIMGGITYKKHNFSGFLPHIFFLTSLEIVGLIAI